MATKSNKNEPSLAQAFFVGAFATAALLACVQVGTAGRPVTIEAQARMARMLQAHVNVTKSEVDGVEVEGVRDPVSHEVCYRRSLQSDAQCQKGTILHYLGFGD